MQFFIISACSQALKLHNLDLSPFFLEMTFS